MAITNKAIIELYKAENGLPINYPLLTYAAWLKQGYQVKKGEKCKHRVPLWRYTQQKNENGEIVSTGKCFYKTMSLFEMSQVERMV